MKWFEPDTRWEIFTKSKEDFIDKYVVEGKFHENVPKDVVNSFETVSYLLAHSYYHWPMYDEALSKALLIMEMAIKLKAKEKGIKLKKDPNKKGIIYSKRLSQIIDEVFEISELSLLKIEFDRARNLRNTKMHPDRHWYGGTLSYAMSNSKLFVNVINQMFITEKILLETAAINNELESEFEIFKNKLSILDYNGKKILIVNAFFIKYIKGTKNNLLTLYVNPIFNDVQSVFIDKKYQEPLVVALKEFDFKEGVLVGTDIYNRPVKVFNTAKKENIERLSRYVNELDSIDGKEIDSLNHYNSISALWQMEDIIYENCWR